MVRPSCLVRCCTLIARGVLRAANDSESRSPTSTESAAGSPSARSAVSVSIRQRLAVADTHSHYSGSFIAQECLIARIVFKVLHQWITFDVEVSSASRVDRATIHARPQCSRRPWCTTRGLAVAAKQEAENQANNAGHLDCTPHQITISNHAPSAVTGAETWNATCKGKLYLCSGRSWAYSCAPVAK